MAMFVCENCKARTSKLIIPRDNEGNGKLHCPSCYDQSTYRPTYLHQMMEGAGDSKGLTEAKSRIIANRVVSRDDKNIVIDRRTGRETQY